MEQTLRIAQIGIAHTHATKVVQPESFPVLQRLDTEFVGVYEPDPEMLSARGGREIWRDIHFIDDPAEILDDNSIRIVFIETWPWECISWARRATSKSLFKCPEESALHAFHQSTISSYKRCCSKRAELYDDGQ